MQELVKITKSTLIITITTFILTGIVCCKSNNTTRVDAPKPEVKKTTTPNTNNTTNAKADKVIKTARSYMGTTYKYGGCSKNGIDCSGLALTSFKSINIELPRTSSDQSTVGKPVKLVDLKPGDLLFFTDKKGNKKIVHVGIVTEVKGAKSVKFIHASTKLGVVENNLYDEWYISIFIKAMRVI
ncbi:MAG: C40 family peptidase [Cytophagaceae bacterium]|nr:C40 family peptidase [Cytophagaceae bacterium]